MFEKDAVKAFVEKATGIKRPSPDEALALVKSGKTRRLIFKPDGYVPNNRKIALLLHAGALRRTKRFDPAAVLEVIFEARGWGQLWRNGIYDYVHYHSKAHEALGVAQGSAKVRLGGNLGISVAVKAGDVIVVPAGVGHECLQASKDFLVVGAYPPGAQYDECRGSFRDQPAKWKSAGRALKPKNDPVYGAKRPSWWSAPRAS